MIPSRKRKAKDLNNSPQASPQKQVAHLQIDESNPTIKHCSPSKIKFDTSQRPCDLNNSLLNTCNISTLKSGKVISNVADQSTLKRRKSIRLLNQQTVTSYGNKVMDAKNINHLPNEESHKTQSVKNSSSGSSRYVQQTLASSSNDTLVITKPVKLPSNRPSVGNENIQPHNLNVTGLAGNNYVNVDTKLHTDIISTNCQRPNIVMEAHTIHNDCKNISSQLEEQSRSTPIASKQVDLTSKEIEMTKVIKGKAGPLSKDKLNNKGKRMNVKILA